MDEILTIRQAAQRYGHTVAGLKMRIRRGKLSAIKGNDGTLRVNAADVASLPVTEKVERPDATLGRIVDELRAELARLGEEVTLAREGAARAEGRAEAEALRREAAEQRVAQLDMVLAEARRPFFDRVFSGLKKNHP
jgi:hypothetical protein